MEKKLGLGKHLTKESQEKASDLYTNKVTRHTRGFCFVGVWQAFLSLHTSPVCCFHLSQKRGEKKLGCYDCVTYIGCCHGDHPPCCQATCDWPCQPLIGRDLLKVPKMLSEKKKDAKKRHIDGVVLPFLSTSKSLLLSSLFWFMYSLIYLCICRRERQLGEALGTACSTFPLKGWTQHQKSPCLLNLNWSQWRWIHALNTHTKT